MKSGDSNLVYQSMSAWLNLGRILQLVFRPDQVFFCRCQQRVR